MLLEVVLLAPSTIWAFYSIKEQTGLIETRHGLRSCLSTAMGYSNAINSLATLLKDGDDGAEQDAQRSIALYEGAVKNGSVIAMNNFAILLRDGKDGIEKDSTRAAELFEEAASGGKLEATTNLGQVLKEGTEDLPKDVVRAVKLLRDVIEEGEYDCAMVDLSELLAEGDTCLDKEVHRRGREHTRGSGGLGPTKR